MRRAAPALILALAIVLATSLTAQRSLDDAFGAFWNAKDPSQAAAAAEAITPLAPSFDAAFQRLRRGRTYSAIGTSPSSLPVRETSLLTRQALFV